MKTVRLIGCGDVTFEYIEEDRFGSVAVRHKNGKLYLVSKFSVRYPPKRIQEASDD